MEDILEFDPATEFQILETFEFEEVVQRPEALRLFTLEEQLLDYFDVRLPKGKITRFQMNELSTEVDRVRDAYLSSVQPTDTLYDVKQKRSVRMPSWVHPLFDTFELTRNSYESSWVPLFSDEQRKLPQAYSRMILSLPKPYKTIASENPPITTNTVGRKEDQTSEVRGMGVFERTKSIIHEDGTQEILGYQIPATQDDLRIQGYTLSRRELELPNPLSGHPFLASADAGKIITKESFEEIYPTVDAILTHAVPTTANPYTEGMKYLKLYDVRLDEIPWSTWKSRFPPVDSIVEPKKVLSVPFPQPDNRAKPSDNLLNVYGKTWAPGIDPRFWIESQEDSGLMVERMLLSKVGESGNVPVEMVGELIDRVFAKTTPEECVNVQSFQGFMESGVSRAKIVEVKKEFDHIDYACVPVAIIQQERKEQITKGRVAWKESTEQDVLRTHQRLIQKFQSKIRSDKVQTYESAPQKEESQLRKDILTLMKDNHRTDTDKSDAIEVLLKDIVPTEKKVFVDANGSFLICTHSLEILKGHYEQDPADFNKKWTAVELGMRVCTSCGEQIGSIYVAQDEFDNDGHLVVSYASMSTQTFHGDTQVDPFLNLLRDLKQIFDMNHAGELVMYILLSLLQVLPTETQLIPVLQFVRDVSKALKGMAAKGKKISNDTQNRIDGILGLVGMVILLQTHQPFLVPRRSFGSKPLSLGGFPRDSADPKTKGILDSLLFILKTTFEAFPATFTGPIVPFIRSVVSKPADVRTEAIGFIQRATQKFKAQFEVAKDRYVVPPQDTINKGIAFPVVAFENTTFKPGETLPQQDSSEMCKSAKPTSTLAPKKGPVLVQKPVVLWDDLEASASAKWIAEPVFGVPKLLSFSSDEVRKRLGMGFPKQLKQLKPSLEPFLKEENDGITILSMLGRFLDILATEQTFPAQYLKDLQKVIVLFDTKISPSLLRDSMLGLMYVLLDQIAKNDNASGLERRLLEEIRNDVVLRMVMIKRAEAEKKEQSLRARERDTLKQRLRSMNDSEREITKKLLDLGIGSIITKSDRELFSKEFEVREEKETTAEGIVDANQPEDGYNDTRDYVDDEAPQNVNGAEMNVDNGDYGDRAVRDYNDYTTVQPYDNGDDYGV